MPRRARRHRAAPAKRSNFSRGRCCHTAATRAQLSLAPQGAAAGGLMSRRDAAEAVDANAALAALHHREIALVAEVRLGPADGVCPRERRHLFALIDLGQLRARGLVRRLAGDVAIVVEADGAFGADVLLAI